MLFLNQTLKTRLTLLKPDIQARVIARQASQKIGHDKSHLREYFVGDQVWAKNVRGKPNWVKGVVVERSGPLSYLVEVLWNGNQVL